MIGERNDQEARGSLDISRRWEMLKQVGIEITRRIKFHK